MCSLRAAVRAATLANRYLRYIVIVILTGYAKADLGKEITRSSKASAAFWLVCTYCFLCELLCELIIKNSCKT